MSYDIEVTVGCNPTGRMPSRRYRPNQDWSWADKHAIHIVAPTVKHAAPALLDIVPHVDYLCLYDHDNGWYWALFKWAETTTDDEVRKQWARFKNPTGKDIAIQRIPENFPTLPAYCWSTR